MDNIKKLLIQQNILFHLNEGIRICTVDSQKTGIELAKTLLFTIVDKKTVLYLSGGKTPKELYRKLAKEEKILPGAVGLVDERFGEKYHPKSNEFMIKETGFTRYLEIRDIPFYQILRNEKTCEETAEEYDNLFRSLNSIFQRSIAICGLGTDGHTAGIVPNRKDFKNPLFDPKKQNLLVSGFHDDKGRFKTRITMTFLGLSMLDLLVILVFGEEKKEALELMFDQGREEEIPARFYKRPDIAKKTILITDQQI